jgi:hypothetical protein
MYVKVHEVIVIIIVVNTFLDSSPEKASGNALKNISRNSNQNDFLGGSSIINELIGLILQIPLFFTGTNDKEHTNTTNKTINLNNIFP